MLSAGDGDVRRLRCLLTSWSAAPLASSELSGLRPGASTSAAVAGSIGRNGPAAPSPSMEDSSRGASEVSGTGRSGSPEATGDAAVRGAEQLALLPPQPLPSASGAQEGGAVRRPGRHGPGAAHPPGGLLDRPNILTSYFFVFLFFIFFLFSVVCFLF
jgi:hypothetical protein